MDSKNVTYGKSQSPGQACVDIFNRERGRFRISWIAAGATNVIIAMTFLNQEPALFEEETLFL